jgi:hypothetical protein
MAAAISPTVLLASGRRSRGWAGNASGHLSRSAAKTCPDWRHDLARPHAEMSCRLPRVPVRDGTGLGRLPAPRQADPAHSDVAWIPADISPWRPW